MLINDERAGIEEQYCQASTSSNLRVEADKRGAADVLIASGLSGKGLGGALMRLHTEYGGGGVPRASMGKTNYRLMMLQMHTFPAVLQAVTEQAAHWGIERPEAVARAVIAHWLDSTCPHCEGRGKEKIKDTPNLSGKNCKYCHGTGKTALSHGSAGKRMAGFVDDCLSRWRQSVAKRLRPTR